ncbi:MAG: EAL domain-containing protein [Actinomycetota bacterium]|nr:EAL domain-containing protein [Actinomycetota bacterium]
MTGSTSGRVKRPQWLGWIQALLGVCLVVAAGLRAPHERWDVGLLVVLAAFAVASELIAVETRSVKLKLSGSFASIVVAMVLLGGDGALVVAVAAVSVGWVRWREAGHYFRNNLLSYAAYAFVTGSLFQAVTHLLVVRHTGPGFYLLIFAAFGLALALNFALVAGYQCLLDGSSLRAKAAEALLPVLSSELASALLAAGTVYVYDHTGLAGVGLVGVVVVVFQYLVGQLLVSQQRGDALEHQAVTDPLTGLPNRAFLLAKLEEAVADGRAEAVMLMDLDGFKEVNDTLGHDYGDALLVVLSTRIREALRGDALVARLGGDEFAIVVEGLEARSLTSVARRLLAILEEPVQIGEMTLEVSGSIGIARSPDDGASPQDLMRRADVAMYAAKQSGSTFEFYSPSRDKHSSRKLALLGDLRRGIEANEIVLEYQPEIEIELPGLCAVEALVRWEHPLHGRLYPSDFVNLAEHSGLIKPLTEHVIDLALATAKEWRGTGLEIRVAVNLSARVLSDRQLPAQIASQLLNAGLSADALTLEVTETMILDDPGRAIETLKRLRDMGVELSIDDFGTGYSSLAHLKQLPISEVKVDRSFVSRMTIDPADAIIVRSTLDLARNLGLRTVAEGVEDSATLAHLRRLGCDFAQGFHLSRPLPSHKLQAWARCEANRGPAGIPEVAMAPASFSAVGV